MNIKLQEIVESNRNKPPESLARAVVLECIKILKKRKHSLDDWSDDTEFSDNRLIDLVEEDIKKELL